MKKLLLIPALLLAACGDNLDPKDQASLGTDEGHAEADTRPWYVSATIWFPSCDAAVASYEADARFGDTNDIELVPNVSCVWTFDDGTTSTSCAGEHTFAEGGWHDFVVVITNLDTGETREQLQRRFVYPPIEATLDVTTSDLTISWNATVNVTAFVHISVEPADLIITDDPFYYLNRTYTLAVREAGTYTVSMDVEDERGAGPICSAHIEKQVEVVCSGTH
jgi:hypothetical protein